MIVYPKEDVHLDRHVPEEIILSCELSRLNGVVNWFKDGQKLQESENIKLKIEGPYRRLKILCSGVEDSGEYVCDTADDSIFFNLSITGKESNQEHNILFSCRFTMLAVVTGFLCHEIIIYSNNKCFGHTACLDALSVLSFSRASSTNYISKSVANGALPANI